MPLQLLSKSAAAFAPRVPPTIVLDKEPEQWLTQTLRRISKVKRPLHTVPQHLRVLTETLGAEGAIWNLCSLTLPKVPEAELVRDEDPLQEALQNYSMVHIQAYVVHVDMVAQHDVAFKLTKESIDTLVKYHHDVYSVDTAAAIFDWPEKDDQIKNLQEDFIQVVNRFVFCTKVKALEGLEEGGKGELLEGRAGKVKQSLMNMFTPLAPPPPRIVDLVIPAAAVSHHPPASSTSYWHPNMGYLPQQQYLPLETWYMHPQQHHYYYHDHHHQQHRQQQQQQQQQLHYHDQQMPPQHDTPFQFHDRQAQQDQQQQQQQQQLDSTFHDYHDQPQDMTLLKTRSSENTQRSHPLEFSCSQQPLQLWTSLDHDVAAMHPDHVPSPTPSASYESSCDSPLYNTPEAMPLPHDFPFPSQLSQGCAADLRLDNSGGVFWDIDSFVVPQYGSIM